jgi:hypothetical protein
VFPAEWFNRRFQLYQTSRVSGGLVKPQLYAPYACRQDACAILLPFSGTKSELTPQNAQRFL